MFASIVFLITCVLLCALFALKYYEGRLGVVYGEAWRARADLRVVALRSWALSHTDLLETLPSIVARYGRFLVHEIALLIAYSARRIEMWAHELADFASHKHSLQIRETRSDFLRQVSEHKHNGFAQDAGDNDSERS